MTMISAANMLRTTTATPSSSKGGADKNTEFLLRSHDCRWSCISLQAGAHSQQDTYLSITRPMAPQSFRMGVPAQVACRVETLQISVTDTNLPEWLDVLVGRFSSLQILNVMPALQNYEAQRMRRLYILYRLPDLETIDGVRVTEEERLLARPDTPNGQRVCREEWLQHLSRDENSQDEGWNEACEENTDDDSYGDCEEDEKEQDDIHLTESVEVALNGSVLERGQTDSLQQVPCEHQDETRLDEPTAEQTRALPSETNEVSKFIPSAPLHTLCSRSNKYLAMEESNITIEIRNPWGAGGGDKERGNRSGTQVKKKSETESPREMLHPQTTRQSFKRQRSKEDGANSTKPLSSDADSPNLADSLENISQSRRQSTHSSTALPRRSLSSPFPIQFRKKPLEKHPAPQVDGFDLNNVVDIKAHLNRKALDDLETIDVPLSPPPTPRQQQRRKMTKRDKPPPCPGSARRVVPEPQRTKRRSSWNLSSVLDDEEEESSDDEELR